MIRISGLSLRHTLALAMSGLTILVLALAVLLANHEVRRSARVAAEERLARVTDQLATLAATSAEQRRDRLLAAGRDPALAALLRGEPVDPDVVEEVLASLRTPADSGLPLELWDLEHRIVFPAGTSLTEAQSHSRLPLDSVPAYGAFHERGEEVLYYSTAPVRDGDVIRGYIVQRRRMGNARTAVEIERLIGRDSRVMFSYSGEEALWVTLAGEAVKPPARQPPPESTAEFSRDDGARFLVHSRAIAGTPWTVLVEMPSARIHAGSHAFLRRMSATGAVLVLAATLLAWLLSRRLTRPLRGLGRVADAVAAGDYTRRVELPRQDGDVARLAHAFNHMADQVAASHQALEQQLGEARALATDLEAASEAAERARAEAVAADRAKSDFLATMSHEIRTPINAVLGLCELLTLEDVRPDRRREYVLRAQRAARQLAGLVDDVLDLAKAESGGLRVRSEVGSVRDAVEHVVGLLEPEARGKSLALEVDVAPDLFYHGDPQRVEQILLNLVANAVKFTPAEGAIRVVGRLERVPGDSSSDAADRDRIRLDVEDTGIGIGEADMARIFEPFVQGQSGYTREYGGTGLGLSISRRLARMMGGDVVAERLPGGGSRFALLLPPAEATALPG